MLPACVEHDVFPVYLWTGRPGVVWLADDATQTCPWLASGLDVTPTTAHAPTAWEVQVSPASQSGTFAQAHKTQKHRAEN